MPTSENRRDIRVLWAGPALSDLKKIRAYISRFHSQAASRIAAQILSAAELLRQNPALGTALAKPGHRRFVIGGTVYVLIYRVRENDLEILEVFDARRRRTRTRL